MSYRGMLKTDKVCEEDQNHIVTSGLLKWAGLDTVNITL